MFQLPSKTIGPIFIVIASSLWAFDGVIRRNLYHLPPVTIVFFEHLIGLLLISPFILTTLKKTIFSRKIIFISAIIGLISGLLGTLWITTALSSVNFISFSVVYLIQKLQPIFVISSAHFILKEKITKHYFIWSLIALIATFFITFPHGYVNFSTGSGTITAALYIHWVQLSVWGIGTTISKLLLTLTTDKIATFLRFLFASLWSFIAIFLNYSSRTFITLTYSDFIQLIMIALSTGLLAMLLYYRGLQKTEAKISAILELTFPLLAVFIDMTFYRTFLSLSQYLAALVLIFSMHRITRLQKLN